MLHRGVVILFACLASLGLAVACQSPRYDTQCTPDEPDYQTGERCLYTGLGRGPAVDEPPCPRLTGAPPAECPPFNGNASVLSVLTDPNRGACSASACHGSPVAPAVGLYLPAGDPEAFYESLTRWTGSVGRPYVDLADPAASWMMCNLRGQLGGGFSMPPPAGLQSKITNGVRQSDGSFNPPAYTSDAVERDLGLVERWLLCGAPPPVDEGSGGGGGAGGAGGEGGAGG